ncbi:MULTISPECIES: phasin family protein [unclassified Acinetobacter]|uniref:phasin family protein n=1 Tax=unclassified Acinetobacter TaxID=196816 RepID=UPI00103C0032|nr:poly(hydroxyalcanoate) granule associated protein [Acinetobacter sp. ANC 4641]TCB24316.1 poly(hydroxyalcanoate) granule associated protein [Acinetobacter sp. ANC 4633]
MSNRTIKQQNESEDMAVEPQVKKNKQNQKTALDFRKYTQQIWLAGLGAFSRAEEEGNKFFDSLVKVGEELEAKTLDFADQTVTKVTDKALESVYETKDKVEKILDQSVNTSLNRLGLASSKDIQHLEQLILLLHSKVDTLIEENHELRQQLSQSSQ